MTVWSRKHAPNGPNGPCHENTWSRKCGADLVFMKPGIFLCSFPKLTFAERMQVMATESVGLLRTLPASSLPWASCFIPDRKQGEQALLQRALGEDRRKIHLKCHQFCRLQPSPQSCLVWSSQWIKETFMN